jgi:hypothetical protein
MKDLDVAVFLAVFQEMLGPLLWLLVAVAFFGIAAFLVALVRERGLRSGRFVVAQLVGLAGGALAILFMQAVTDSGFRDIGGPIDWVLVALIFVVGAVGTTILAYGLIGLAARRRAA